MKTWLRRIAICATAWSCLAAHAQDAGVAAEAAPVGNPSSDGAATPADVIPAAPNVDSAPAPGAARNFGPSSVQEVIVTAQKRSESINSVPIAISAFNGDDLKTLGVKDTRDLGNLVPGFTYGDSGYGVPVYSIRGIGFNDPSESASSTVGIYNDEFNLPFPVFSKGGNLDLQRVEILKGPQGTLYGRNTTGGLVNYIANKPTDKFEAGITATLQNFGVKEGEAYISGPLEDNVRARFAYRRTYSGIGWQRSNTRYPDEPDDTLGRQNKQSARFIMDWKPVDGLTTSITLSGWTDRGDPQAPQAIAITPQNATAGSLALSPQVADYPLVPMNGASNRTADWSPNLDFHLAEKFGMAGLRSDYAFGEQSTLTFLGSYASFEINHSILPQTGLNSNNTEREMVDHTNADAFELRLASGFGKDIHYLLGGYYSHDRVNDFNRIFVDTNSAVYPIPPVGGVVAVIQPVANLLGITTIPSAGDLFTNRVDAEGIQRALTYAGFANGDWQFLPTLKLQVGLRYTEERRNFFGCTRDDTTESSGIGFSNAFDGVQVAQAALHGAPPPTMLAQRGGCIEYDPKTFNSMPYTGVLDEPNLSYRTSLNWTPLEDLLFYGSYSRGFKSGSFPIVAASTNAQYKPVVEEKLNAYEVGTKTAFFDRRLRVNSSAFYYGYRNKQLYGVIYDQIFGPLPELVNAPKSKVEGIEAEVQTSPLRGLFVSLSGVYLRTVIGKFSTLDARGNPQDLTGKPFNYTPRLSATLLANYTYPIFEADTIGLGGDYSYRSQTNSILTDDPLFVIQAYRLMNVHLDYVAEAGWGVSLFGHNVLNEFYSNGSINTGDTVARFTGQPRTYGVSASYQFR